MKSLIGFLVVALILFIVVPKLVQKQEKSSDGEITKKAKLLGKTPELKALISTTEFFEVIITKEFRQFASAVGKDQLMEIINPS
jgi:membrane protein implicated in regulation of membrane protease activity